MSAADRTLDALETVRLACASGALVLDRMLAGHQVPLDVLQSNRNLLLQAAAIVGQATVHQQSGALS